MMMESCYLKILEHPLSTLPQLFQNHHRTIAIVGCRNAIHFITQNNSQVRKTFKDSYTIVSFVFFFFFLFPVFKKSRQFEVF